MDPTQWQDEIAALDATQPWFEPYAGWLDEARPILRPSGGAGAVLCAIADHLPAQALPRFVASGELPAGEAYEAFVARTGSVPTRDNLHDFFNGLVWLRFPLAKRRLNELQAGEITCRGIGPARGAVRDALTLFDENGALLDAPAPLWDALRARDWRRLFVDLRPLWAQARVLVFGHALLEKLVRPRKDITAHLWCAPCALDSMEGLDRWLAGQLTAGRLAAKPFTPLPLLGVPGWSAGNENFSFYDDSLVFRPAGRRGLARAT